MKVKVVTLGPSYGSAPPRVFTGSHVIVSTVGVCLDSVWVIERDRRMKSNRVPGHPWMTRQDGICWASFRVDIDPDA